MRKKILIVDDSATAIVLLKSCFSDYVEYEIIQAKQWEDAVNKAKLYHPFLVILDYNMPEKSGAQIASLMQQQGVSAYYVLLTANTQRSVINEVRALNFFEILEKPITAENIKALLERLS